MTERHLRGLGGRPHFLDQGWDAVGARLEAPWRAAGSVEDLAHIRAIVQSVCAAGRDVDLAVSSGFLGDLTVTPKPLGDPPYDVVTVVPPNAMAPPPKGAVRIEHVPLVGRSDSIIRPVSETVPLFWRFMIEKYGISPA